MCDVSTHSRLRREGMARDSGNEKSARSSGGGRGGWHFGCGSGGGGGGRRRNHDRQHCDQQQHQRQCQHRHQHQHRRDHHRVGHDNPHKLISFTINVRTLVGFNELQLRTMNNFEVVIDNVIQAQCLQAAVPLQIGSPRLANMWVQAGS